VFEEVEVSSGCEASLEVACGSDGSMLNDIWMRSSIAEGLTDLFGGTGGLVAHFSVICPKTRRDRAHHDGRP
jgi:hypothetical protein